MNQMNQMKQSIRKPRDRPSNREREKGDCDDYRDARRDARRNARDDARGDATDVHMEDV